MQKVDPGELGPLCLAKYRKRQQAQAFRLRFHLTARIVLYFSPQTKFRPMTREEKFMQEAIRLSQSGMQANQGGPFGCVIVKGEEIIGRGNNQVLLTNDPTAHAEVVAIRDACQQIGNFQLDDCEVYTSCEPCPMCLGALYWARPKVIYYANHRQDAARIGFDDSMIYEEICKDLPERKITMIPLGREQAIGVFEEWEKKDNKGVY